MHPTAFQLATLVVHTARNALWRVAVRSVSMLLNSEWELLSNKTQSSSVQLRSWRWNYIDIALVNHSIGLVMAVPWLNHIKTERNRENHLFLIPFTITLDLSVTLAAISPAPRQSWDHQGPVSQKALLFPECTSHLNSESCRNMTVHLKCVLNISLTPNHHTSTHHWPANLMIAI